MHAIDAQLRFSIRHIAPSRHSPGLMTSPCLTRNSLFAEPSIGGSAGPMISLEETVSEFSDDDECKGINSVLLVRITFSWKDPVT